MQVLIHAAYVPSSVGPDSFEVNVAGTRTLVDAARTAGAKVIFISSLAAHSGARSSYGRQKLAIEQALDGNDLAIRPGLIIGAGGIFGRLVTYVRSGKPIPLVDRGQQPLQTIYLDDLLQSALQLVRSDASGYVVLAEEPATPYRAFFEALCARLGCRNRFAHLPSSILLAATTAASRLRIPLPIERDNVLGLLEMRFMKPTPAADYSLPPFRRYASSIEAFCTFLERSAPL